MVGFNFRLGEIESAIAKVQLSKLSRILDSRIERLNLLTTLLSDISVIAIPPISNECDNGYYIYPIVLDDSISYVGRDKIVDALIAEGLQGLSRGYALLHTLPIFQQKIAFGSNHFPWQFDGHTSDVSYDYGICPVAEKLHTQSFIGFLTVFRLY